RPSHTDMRQSIQNEIALLRAKLTEAEETLRAIRHDEVDAVVVETRHGDRIFTLHSADQAYRIFIEQMHEGAVCLMPDGTITYANHCLAEIVGVPLERV